jgi:hypothetical protein
MANAQLLNLRLFLEGIEVPVISASVVNSIGSPATANIEIVGDPKVLQFAPRTMVHLFVYDPLSKSKTKPKSADGKYTLLFAGDLMSVTYSKTGSSRNAIMSCQDDSSYYDLAYTYFVSNQNLQRGTIQTLTLERAYFVGASTGMYGATGAADLLGTILEEVFRDPKPRTFGFAGVDGLLGAILRLIERFTGVADLSRGGVNQFFSFHSRRKRLLNQIYVTPDDNLAHHLLSSSFIVEFIKRKSGSLGELITLRQLAKYILDFIYYRFIPNSCPYYEPVGKETTGYVSNVAANAVLARITTRIENIPEGSEPSYVRIAIPVDNTEISQISIETDKDIKELKAISADLDPATQAMVEALLISLNQGNLQDAKVHATTLSNNKVRIPVVESKLDRMYTTNIMPDLYFGVAPTCNVLYPDMYQSLNYSRSLSSECTRLHLTTNIERGIFGGTGADQLIYYAPSIDKFTEIQSVSAGSIDASSSSQQAYEHARDIISGKLFDHELYTGIIPSFSTVDRLAYTAALASARNIETNSSVNDEVREKVQELKTSMNDQSDFSDEERDDFFIRIANGQFIRKKLAGRRASVMGVLNTYAVVGLPMVVIDGLPVTGRGDKFDSPKSPSQDNEHYVGLLTSITHSVSQQGAGTTSYELQYVRPHRSKDDEFLSNLSTLKIQSLEGDPPVKVSFLDLKSVKESDNLTDDQLRNLSILLGCTKSTGSDYVAKIHTSDGKQINVPTQAGRYGRGSEVLGKYIRAVSVDVASHAGGLKDVNGFTLSEQREFIANNGVDVYLQQSVGNTNRLAIGSVTYRIMRDLLSGDRQPEPSEDIIKACSDYIYKVGGRFPLPVYTSINVYYGKLNQTEEVASPIEEMIRPRYVDDIYSSALIGDKVYKPMLGVKSIIDSNNKKAEKLGLPKYDVRVAPGKLTTTNSTDVKSVISQESAIDILAYEYATSVKSGRSLSSKKVFRQIATLPDVLERFHLNSWAISNADKPIALIDDTVYDKDKQKCPDGYRAATQEEVIEINKRLNPALDVRESRNIIIREYRNKLKSRGNLG